jgi:hypothetical protein
MNKFIAILGLAFIPVLFPPTGQAKVHALHPSRFSIGKLSTREERNRTYVDGEITSSAKKEASTVYISVSWFNKDGKVVADELTSVHDLAPGETLPFHVSTNKNAEIVRYDATVKKSFGTREP